MLLTACAVKADIEMVVSAECVDHHSHVVTIGSTYKVDLMHED